MLKTKNQDFAAKYPVKKKESKNFLDKKEKQG